VAVLEDQFQQAVGGANGHQVQPGRGGGMARGAEGHRREHERQPEDEREHDRRGAVEDCSEVVAGSGGSGHRVADPADLARCGGQHAAAQNGEGAH